MSISLALRPQMVESGLFQSSQVTPRLAVPSIKKRGLIGLL